MRKIKCLLILVCVLLLAGTSIASQKRTALIIGNSKYKSIDSLRNPVNDAIDMKKALVKLDFDVILRTNASRSSMRSAVRQFGDKIRKGGVGLFYYAGHGVQVEGVNYIIPVDVDIKRKYDIEDQGLQMRYVLGAMEEANNNLNIIILDACRNNPFKSFRGSADGLARMDAPAGSIIAYATAPGERAADGAGRNGTYTSALLNNITQPNISVQEMLNQTGLDVMTSTRNQQVPWISSTPIQKYYLAKYNAPGSSTPTITKTKTYSPPVKTKTNTYVPKKQSTAPSVSGTMWSGTDSKGDYYEYNFLPNGQMHYKNKHGFWKNGTWRQTGDTIYMETNKKYSERKGRIVGTKMTGKGWNIAGLKWDWSATNQTRFKYAKKPKKSYTKKSSKVPSVSGTMWAGTDSKGAYYEYNFKPNGEMHYKSKTGFWKNGTWKQTGDTIYMETNKKYSERKGKIVGNKMTGKGWNVAGLKWDWSATNRTQSKYAKKPKKSYTKKSSKAPSVSGTMWAGMDSDDHYYEYHFIPNGEMHYKSYTGFWKNGTWKQTGNKIYMETNKKYCEYEGTIVGNKMEGRVWNVTGKKWTWAATNQTKPTGVKRPSSTFHSTTTSFAAIDGVYLTIWYDKLPRAKAKKVFDDLMAKGMTRGSFGPDLGSHGPKNINYKPGYRKAAEWLKNNVQAFHDFELNSYNHTQGIYVNMW